MKQKIVRITENDLHTIIKRVLREYNNDFNKRLAKYGNLNDDDWEIVDKETQKQKAQRAAEEAERNKKSR